MSTNSIIAKLDSDCGWAGRHCHWDGYPEHMGSTLWELRHRDGLIKMVNTLIVEHTGWSTVDPLHDDNYGEGKKDPSDPWIKGTDTDFSGAEWVYVLTEDALKIGIVNWPLPRWTTSKTVTFEAVGIVPWNSPEPNWEAITKMMARR